MASSHLPTAKPEENRPRLEAAAGRLRFCWTSGRRKARCPAAPSSSARKGKSRAPRGISANKDRKPTPCPFARTLSSLMGIHYQARGVPGRHDARRTRPVEPERSRWFAMCRSSRPTARKATLVQHLFTHTSGFAGHVCRTTRRCAKKHAPIEGVSSPPGRAPTTVPAFKPGTQLSYQSMGTAVGRRPSSSGSPR